MHLTGIYDQLIFFFSDEQVEGGDQHHDKITSVQMERYDIRINNRYSKRCIELG